MPRLPPYSHVKSRDDPISGRRGDSRVQFYFIYIDNSYAHDDQGDNPGQATEGSTVSSIKCDRCWHLD